MRLKKRLAADRLQRVRERAHSARSAFAQARTARRLPAPRPRDLCGTWADQPPARRAEERTETEGQISMRRLGSFGFDLPLHNLSVSGCKVELVEAVAVKDHVIARLPGLEPLGAVVTWVGYRTAGLQFDRPLHPAVLELLIDRLG